LAAEQQQQQILLLPFVAGLLSWRAAAAIVTGADGRVIAAQTGGEQNLRQLLTQMKSSQMTPPSLKRLAANRTSYLLC
jgi:hypothetical protein